MTWKSFVDAIYESEIVSGSPAKILVNLFAAAGRMKGFEESTAQAWIAGSRNCQASRYFPNGKLNDEEGAFRFFRRRPNERLQTLQQTFRKMAIPSSPIDTNTNDLDIFCWSLVNQFLDLLQFQRLNITSANETESGLTAEVQEELDDDSLIEAPSVFGESKDGAQLHIEEKYKYCRFCLRWKGSVADILEVCKAYKEKRKATDGAGCEHYEPNEGRITVQILAGSKHK